MDCFTFVGTEVVLCLLLIAIIYAHESEKSECPKKTSLFYAGLFVVVAMFGTMLGLAMSSIP